MQRLLPFNPDAVFAASDVMAIGALRALRDAGRRVPEDVALSASTICPSPPQRSPADHGPPAGAAHRRGRRPKR